MDGGGLVHDFLRHEFSHSPLLTNLSLDASDRDHTTQFWPKQFALFEDPFPFPSLVTLTLVHTPSHLLLAINCPLLRVLKIRHLSEPPSAATYLWLLSETPLLEELEIDHALGSDEWDDGEVLRVSLPRLRSLALEDSKTQEMSVILQSLVLPANVAYTVSRDGYSHLVQSLK